MNPEDVELIERNPLRYMKMGDVIYVHKDDMYKLIMELKELWGVSK